MVEGGRGGRRRMKNVGKPFVMPVVLAIVGIAQGQQVRLRSAISLTFAV